MTSAPIDSAAQDNTIYGGTFGVDYQLTPNYLVGIAPGGSNGKFSVPDHTTSGSTTGPCRQSHRGTRPPWTR